MKREKANVDDGPRKQGSDPAAFKLRAPMALDMCMCLSSSVGALGGLLGGGELSASGRSNPCSLLSRNSTRSSNIVV